MPPAMAGPPAVMGAAVGLLAVDGVIVALGAEVPEYFAVRPRVGAQVSVERAFEHNAREWGRRLRLQSLRSPQGIGVALHDCLPKRDPAQTGGRPSRVRVLIGVARSSCYLSRRGTRDRRWRRTSNARPRPTPTAFRRANSPSLHAF